MKKMVFMILMFFPCLAIAEDNFTIFFYSEAGLKWKFEAKLAPGVKLHSRFKINRDQYRLVRKTYFVTKEKFGQYFNVDFNLCEKEDLRIRIISEEDLSNHKYFPNESDCTKAGWVVIGRYFRMSNVLYIVPPWPEKYHWRKNFAHELTHAFFDRCGMRFRNNDLEHKELHEFLKTYPKDFY